MNYKETLKSIDTEKALGLIGIEFESQGAYAKFACPQLECDGKAAIKEYGDKKNLYYCPKCKSSGHIISLVMRIKNIDWNAANEFLLKARSNHAKRITEELNINYELFYNDFIKSKGIEEEMCKLLEIGVPKGKTMLAGSVAFAVRDTKGMKVAYYGIKMKDGKPVFHNTFNPELYLYNFCNIDFSEPVHFTTDIFRCVYNIENGRQCVCNFGLPYLSDTQLELLHQVEHIVLLVDEPLVKPLAIQMAENKMNYFRFE
jgi:hypothetical protein